MRAIVRCYLSADVSQEEKLLANALETGGWWPALPQDHPLVLDQKDHLLRTSSEAERTLTLETAYFIIREPTTRTWGIVSQPSVHIIEFRLSSEGNQLADACHKLIDDLIKFNNEMEKDVFRFDQPSRAIVLLAEQSDVEEQLRELVHNLRNNPYERMPDVSSMFFLFRIALLIAAAIIWLIPLAILLGMYIRIQMPIFIPALAAVIVLIDSLWLYVDYPDYRKQVARARWLRSVIWSARQLQAKTEGVIDHPRTSVKRSSDRLGGDYGLG